jgi:hypothetical protein
MIFEKSIQGGTSSSRYIPNVETTKFHPSIFGEKETISGSKKLCPQCDGRGWVLPKRYRELDDNMSDFCY